MSKQYNDGGLSTSSKAQKVDNLVTWVRLALPIILASIGWYVGHTVGTIDKRLTALETTLAAEMLESAVHNARYDTLFEANIKWLETLERKININLANSMNKNDYLRDKAEIRADIKNLENKHAN